MASLKQDLAAIQSAPTTGDCDVITGICSSLSIKTSAAKNFLGIALANAMLMDKKQQDYGPGNISAFGTFGVTVRMNDKMERLKTLFNKGRRKRAINESIQDTFRDISNYAIIALMLELDMWPND